MYGGLLKTASAAAILAAAGFFGAGSAKAADLGGDCCADLEERVAELEATTVRKGNRKVSLAISGYVSHHVMYWDDGANSDTYIGDGGNYGSRWRFTGSAKISPTVTAGFLYEFTAFANAIGNLNQSNGGDDLGASGGGSGTGGTPGNTALRDSTVWLRHSQLGMIKVGHGSTSTDNLVLIDLGGLSGASTPDVALYNGGFRLVRNGIISGLPGSGISAATWSNIIVGGESWDTTRRNHVLYETPTLAGFTVQAAFAEDNYWDVALRYAGEHHGFRVAFGIGYQEDTEFNQAIGAFPQDPTPVTGFCSSANHDCSRKESQLKGSASVLHVSTGLFLTGAAGTRDIEDKSTFATNRNFDANFWYLAGGISQNWFGIGKTVLFGEYSEHNDALKYAFADVTESKATVWGLGVVQYVDAAAMEIFLTYKSYSADVDTTLGTVSGLEDFQTVIGGARISF
jgi:hypothetical protein